jgi:CTP synthase
MENRGLKVTFVKLDPYINVDPGTMNPYQHGEVFVTDDGAETDLDLGHYERYVSARMSRKNNLTAGQIYDTVIQKERRGEYLGGTVQVIPHITDEIKRRIEQAAENVDLCIVEVGGTVGDIESLPFLEAIRQFKIELGPTNAINIHVTLVPYIATAGEVKTKPTQHSVKELLQIGIQPEILLCRTDRVLPREIKQKIALFCNVPAQAVITARDVETIYEVPLTFREEGLDDIIAELLNIWSRAPSLEPWQQVVDRIKNPRYEVSIAVVGKYVSLKDSYKSLHEALVHGGLDNHARVNLLYIDAEELEGEPDVGRFLTKADGVLVPGGFGGRGTEGKVRAIEFARTGRVPYFGICYGMQLAVVEFARHLCGLSGANSSEIDPQTPHPVVDLMPDQRGIADKGATMRLGAYPCRIEKGSIAFEAYGASEISERHRHRFEINNRYREQLTAKGMVLSGLSPDGRLVEIVEIPDHPWFLGCQFHPEFKSRPLEPHPLFSRFIKASLERKLGLLK